MALNRARANGRKLNHNVSGVTGSGAGGLVLSGDPVAIGTLPGVALTDEASDGTSTVDHGGVYYLEVSPTAAIDPTDPAACEVFLDTATGVLSDDATGVFFGNALEPVGAGATKVIEVRIGR